MQKNSSVSFRNEIIHIISVYTLLPLSLIAAAFFIFSYIYFDTGVLQENRNDNESIVQNLDTIVQVYSRELASSVFDFDSTQLKTDSGNSRFFLISMVRFMNQQGNMADFYLFDSDYKPVLSSSAPLLSFMPPDVGKNWGIIRKMDTYPGEVRCSFFNGSLLIGKKILNGYAVFVIPSQYFSSHMLEKQSAVIVTNHFNDVCLSTVPYFTGSFSSARTEAVSSGSFFAYRGHWYFKTAHELPLGGESFTVYTFSSIRRIVVALLFEVSFLVLIIALAGWISFSAAVRATNKKTESISNVVSCLKEVQKGNFAKRMEIDAQDEFVIIADSYNMMIQSISDLIEKNKEISRETVTAQIKQLESQFNPHFLFNTLEIIKYMVKLDPQDIPVIITNLSKLLRYSISVTDNDITLSEDISYTNNYLSIQKFRFTDRFSYILDIADDTLDCIVPKLIVQPLIENAILYSISGSRKKTLTVGIHSCIKDGRLHIIVTDDGVGMSREKIAELEEQLGKKDRTTSHMGLYNINRRIHLLHGDAAGFIIESELGKGTSVSMYFPAVHRGQHNV